jgi:hypothetical protein
MVAPELTAEADTARIDAAGQPPDPSNITGRTDVHRRRE